MPKLGEEKLFLSEVLGEWTSHRRYGDQDKSHRCSRAGFARNYLRGLELDHSATQSDRAALRSHILEIFRRDENN